MDAKDEEFVNTLDDEALGVLVDQVLAVHPRALSNPSAWADAGDRGFEAIQLSSGPIAVMPLREPTGSIDDVHSLIRRRKYYSHDISTDETVLARRRMNASTLGPMTMMDLMIMSLDITDEENDMLAAANTLNKHAAGIYKRKI